MNLNKADGDRLNNRIDTSKNDIKLSIPIKQFLYFDVTKPHEFIELEKTNYLNIHSPIPVVLISTLFDNLRLELLHKVNNKFQDSSFLTSSQAKIEIIEELRTHRLYIEKLYETLVSLKYNYYSDYIEEGDYVIADEIAYLYNENKKFIVTKGDLKRIGVINHGILSSCGFEDGCSLFYEKYYHSSLLIPVLQNGLIVFVNKQEIEKKEVYESPFLIDKDKVNHIKTEYTKENIELTIKECLINDLLKISETESPAFLYSYFQITERFEIKEAKMVYTGFTKTILGIEFGPGFYQWIVLSINEFNCKTYLKNIYQIIEFDKHLRDEWILDILYNNILQQTNEYIKLTGNKKGFVVKILEEFSFVFNSEGVNKLLDSKELRKYIKKYNIILNKDFIQTLFTFSYCDIQNSLTDSCLTLSTPKVYIEEDSIYKEQTNLKEKVEKRNIKKRDEKVNNLIDFLEKEYKVDLPLLYSLEKFISLKCNNLFSIKNGFYFNIKYNQHIKIAYTNYSEFQRSLKNINLLNEFYLQTEEYINKEPILSSLSLAERKKLKLESNLIKHSEINSKFSNEKNVFFSTEKTYLILQKDIIKMGRFDSKINKLKTVIKIEILNTDFMPENNKLIKNKCEICIKGKNYVKREDYKKLIPYFLLLPLFIKEGLIEILINFKFIKFHYKKYVVYIELKDSGYEFLTDNNLSTYDIRISAHDSFGYVFDRHNAFEKVIIKDISQYLKYLDFLVDSILIFSNNKMLYTNEEVIFTNKETEYTNNTTSEDKIYEIFTTEEICSTTLLTLKSQLSEFIEYKEVFSLEEFKSDFIKTNINKSIPVEIRKTLKENVLTVFQNPVYIKTLFNFIEEKNFFIMKISEVYFYLSPYFLESNNLVTNSLLRRESFCLKTFYEKNMNFALNHINPFFCNSINNPTENIKPLMAKENLKAFFRNLSKINYEKYNVDSLFTETGDNFLLKGDVNDEICMLFMVLNFGGDISIG